MQAGAKIRLVRLQPAKDLQSPIACTLQTVSLDEHPHFEALSYTWGRTTIYATRCVHLNGKECAVTMNLWQALRYLRHQSHERIIFVDALCIYPDRHRTNCCRNLRCEPQFCKGVGFAHLACRIGKFTLRVHGFLLHLIIPLRVALPVLRLNMTTYPCFETARISPDKDLSPSLGSPKGL
jgi:hypothetical protein